MKFLVLGDYVYRKAEYSKRVPIARINGPYGLLLEQDSQENFYLDGELIAKSKGQALLWSARWVYDDEEELMRTGRKKRHALL